METPTIPYQSEESFLSFITMWLKTASVGELTRLAEQSLIELANKLASPDTLDEFHRWRPLPAGSPSDWNTMLAAPAQEDEETPEETADNTYLIPPLRPDETLPSVTKSVENIHRIAETAQAALYNHNKRALDGDYEGLLGIKKPEQGPFRMAHYFGDTLKLSSYQVDKRGKMAEHLFPFKPSVMENLSGTVEIHETRLKHFGAALLENGSDGPRENEIDIARVDGGFGLFETRRLKYGVSMGNAEVMIDFYKRMKSYAKKSKVPFDHFEAVMEQVEEIFLEDARELSTYAFARLLKSRAYRVEMMLHEDGPEPQDDAPREKKNSLSIREISNNGVEIRGRFYGTDAEKIRTMQYQLERITPDKSKRKKADDHSPKEEPTPDIPAEGLFAPEEPVEAPEAASNDEDLALPDEQSADLGREDIIAEYADGEEIDVNGSYGMERRSHEQLFADIFMLVLSAGFRAGSRVNGIPQNRGVDTTMLVMMDYETLKGYRDGADAPPDPPPRITPEPLWYEPSTPEAPRISETQYGGHMDPTELRSFLCDAKIIPAVLNGKSRPVDLGRGSRFFSHEQYLLLLARDRGCTVPGCTVPGAWCQTHHALEWWQHGGKTDVSNGTLVCQRHHTDIHSGKWKIISIDDRGVWYQPAPWLSSDQMPIRNRVWDTAHVA